MGVREEVGIPAPHLSGGQDPHPSPAFLGCPWGLWAEINPLCLAPGPPSGKALPGRWFFPGCSLPTGGAPIILLLWTWRHFLNWALQQREENSGRARHIPPVPRTAPVSKGEGGHPPQNPNGEKVKTTTPNLGLHQSLMSDPTVAILRARGAPEAHPPQSCSGSLTACLQHGCVPRPRGHRRWQDDTNGVSRAHWCLPQCSPAPGRVTTADKHQAWGWVRRQGC